MKKKNVEQIFSRCFSALIRFEHSRRVRERIDDNEAEKVSRSRRFDIELSSKHQTIEIFIFWRHKMIQ